MSPSSSHSAEREQLKSSRLRRYSEAENALKSASATLSEVSPQELQIRVLRQATAVLNARAEEARDRSAKLRALLTHREMDPAEYETLQTERWLEEKRQFSFDRESKIINDHLKRLEVPGLSIDGPRRDSVDKRQANLAHFLASSTTRKQLSVRAPLPPSWHPPRRMSVANDFLTRSSRMPDFTEDMNNHFRTRSLDGAKFLQPGSKLDPIESRTRMPDHIAVEFGFGHHRLDSVEEDATSDRDDESLTYRSASPSLTSSTGSALEFFQTDTRLTSPRRPTSSTHIIQHPILPYNGSADTFDGRQGKATIYHSSGVNLRPEDEILAGMSHVSIPRYAKDLLHDFEEEIPSRVSPRLPFSMTRRRRPSAPLSDISDWEVLSDSAAAEQVSEPQYPDVISILPPMHRKGHRTLFSLDSPLMTTFARPGSSAGSSTRSTTTTRPRSVLRKRPSHRPVHSLVVIPEASRQAAASFPHCSDSGTSKTNDHQTGRCACAKDRSLGTMGMFNSRRTPVETVEVKVSRTTTPDLLVVLPQSPFRVEHDSVQGDPPSASSTTARGRGLRRKLSLGRLLDSVKTSGEGVGSAESLGAAVPEVSDNVQGGGSLRARVKRRLLLGSLHF